MEKSSYWAIFKDKDVTFEGTFTECWNMLLVGYADCTVAKLAELKIRIARKS